MARFAGVLQEIEAMGILSTLVRKGKALFSIWNSMDAAERKVAELLELKFCDEKADWIENRKALCSCILENVIAASVGR